MKKIYRISSFVLALALCALTACTKTEIDDVVMVPDGSSARVALNFNVKSSVDVTTRAAQGEYNEYLVENIYVLIFNGNQRIELSENANDKNGNVNFFSPEEIKNYQNKLDDAGIAESSGTIEFDAISGAGLKICAVANLGVSNSMTRADFDEDALTKDLTKFAAIKTYDEFKKMSLDLRTHSIARGASFLMTGEANDVTLNAYTGKESEKTTTTIYLERTDSKITFNVKAANDNLKDFEFVPLKWRVVNVPTVSYVLPRIEDTAASTTLTENLDATVDNVEADFFSIPAEEAILFEGKVQDNNGDPVDNSGTFTFYMYENLKAPQQTIEGSDAAAYALREKQVKTETSSGVTGQRYENGDYMYAPKSATYVVFTGQVSYTETDEETKQDRFVLADVEYSVHLGHGSNTNVNSYNTLRNHHYTYNVTVTGINDLLVEVESNNPSEGEPTDDERRPGVEGDIVMSASQIVEVDGHYDRALITLTAEEANKIFFAISTPWERGLDTNGFLEANNTTMRDYKWVKFLIHDENLDIEDGHLAAYPGEQCYDGGKTDTGTAAVSTAYGGNSVTLRDIRQLSNYFRTNPLGADETVAITMFIDEYLYYYDPTSDPVTTPAETKYKGVTDLTLANDAGLLLWKKSVNNEPRLMHIVKAGDMTYSADGETSLSRSVVTIKQKPIISLYNTSASDLVSAWGTETVNETPRLIINRTSYPEQGDNYYANAQINNSTKDSSGNILWAKAISSEERYGLGTDYTDPSYACAMRNRDFNGDGTINKEEILWYLAALEQMTGLWIADPIMPNDAKLYDPQNPDGYYADPDYNRDKTPATHYVTSTLSGIYPYIYWAEEYGATSTRYNELYYGKAPVSETDFNKGNVATIGNDNSNYNNFNQYAIVSLRCLRNLGMPYENIDEPQPYYQFQPAQIAGQTRTKDITDVVLDDGAADSDEYDEKEQRTVEKEEYDNTPNVPDYSNLSNNSSVENAYGKVTRSRRGINTYYIYKYWEVATTTIDASITLPYINKGALRTITNNSNSLPYAHIDDIGENNRPFTGFFVLQSESGSFSWNDAYMCAIGTQKVCPEGYRVPNQREMLLMSELITDGWDNGTYIMLNGQYLSGRTGSNFGAFYYYSGQSRIGRVLTTINDNDLSKAYPSAGWNISPRVRCVKDNPNAKHSSSSDFNEGGEG